MNKIFSLNKVWIEFISEFPSDDKYCKNLWEELKWEVTTEDYDNKESFIIGTKYNFGNKDDSMETWTEPFGTSKRFYKWCSEAKKFLLNKFPKNKIECFKKKEKYLFHLYFKIH